MPLDLPHHRRRVSTSPHVMPHKPAGSGLIVFFSADGWVETAACAVKGYCNMQITSLNNWSCNEGFSVKRPRLLKCFDMTGKALLLLLCATKLQLCQSFDPKTGHNWSSLRSCQVALIWQANCSTPCLPVIVSITRITVASLTWTLEWRVGFYQAHSKQLSTGTKTHTGIKHLLYRFSQ